MILNKANLVGEALELNKRETVICVQNPLFHCMAMIMCGVTTLTHGTKCVLPYPIFKAEESLKAIDREKCTTIHGTPTMFIDLCNHPNLSKYDVSSLDSGKA